MKKIILLALTLLGISFAASAQMQILFVEDISDGTVVYDARYYIDRTAKKLYPYDPEEPSVIENPQDYTPYDIKSCKKEGNKETIIFTQPNYPVEYKIEIVINPKLTNKDDLSGQTLTFSTNFTDEKEVSKVLLEEQLPDDEKESLAAQRKWREQEAARKNGTIVGGGGSSNGGDNAKNPADKLIDKGKDGVKNLLNKGKDLLKKKE